MPYTRIAVAQVPADLVGRHLPAAIRELDRDLRLSTDDHRTLELLRKLREKLTRLDDNIRRMADAQGFSYVRSILSFCGSKGRNVQILIFPEIAVPASWPDVIRKLCNEHEIPLLILGSHDFGCAYERNGPDYHVAVDPPVVVRVRSWNELPAHNANPPPAIGGAGRTLVAVPARMSAAAIGPQIEGRALALRANGIATAVANTEGHSRFYVRSWLDDVGEGEISDDRPLGAFLYRIPAGSHAVNILDIDLAYQAGGWLDTRGFFTRPVTVAPLIPEALFPDYCCYLRELEGSPLRSEEVVRAERARQVRRATMNTLKYLETNGSSEFKSLEHKIVQIEEACQRTLGIAILQRYAEPGDFQRLVDAVIIPRAETSLASLVGSTCEVLSELVNRLPLMDRAPFRNLIERVQRLGESNIWVMTTEDAPALPSRIDKRPMGEPPPSTRRSVADFLALVEILFDTHYHWGRIPTEKQRAIDGGKLLQQLHRVLKEFEALGRIQDATLDDALLYLRQELRLPYEAFPAAASGGTVEVMIARQMASIEDPKKAAMLLSLMDIAEKSLDIQAITSELGTTDKEGAEAEVLKEIGPLVHAVRRRQALQHCSELRLLTFDLRGRSPLLVKDLIRRRFRAISLALEDDADEILRGLLEGLEVIYDHLVILYRDTLRGLARLSATERKERLETRQQEILRDLPLLRQVVGELLSSPQEAWEDVPHIFTLMRGLLEAKQEVSILTLLAMLPDLEPSPTEPMPPTADGMDE
jgi:hypothetical protein